MDVFTAVRRTSSPKATVHEKGVSVRIDINVEPDGHWERFFREQQDDDGLSRRARLVRRDRNAHPGTAFRTGIQFSISSPEQLAAETEQVDGFIEGANRKYLEVHLPAEQAREEAERKGEDQRAATQAKLDQIAATLVPPGGEEEPAPTTSRRW